MIASIKINGTLILIIMDTLSSEVNFRILILDDNVEAAVSRPKDANGNIVRKPFMELGDNCKSKLQRKKINNENASSSYDFDTIFNEKKKIEIIVCSNIFVASRYLLNLHFDIIIADIDFKDQTSIREDDKNREIPSLGGMLFAMAFINLPNTFVRVYTAKDGTLRKDNPDYLYLAEMMMNQQNNRKFKFISFGMDLSTKSPQTEIEKSFYSPENENNWLQKTLPNLKPSFISLRDLAEDLRSRSRNSDRELEIYVDRNAGYNEEQKIFSRKISNQMICNFIKDEDKKKVAGLLLKQVCGHALVRYIFGKLFHLSSNNKDDLIKLLEGKEVFDKTKKRNLITDNFNFSFNDACKLFNLNKEILKLNMTEALKLNSGRKVSDYFRINFYCIFEEESNDKGYLYGLWESLESKEEFKWALKKCVEHIVVSEKDQISCKNVNIKVDDSLNNKTIISIHGNRTDSKYFDIQLPGGSSIDANLDLYELLKNFVCEIKILGEAGSFTLLANGEKIDKNKEEKVKFVTIQIELNHIPDLLNSFSD